MESKTDGQQLLRNPDIEPTSENIAEGLRAAHNAYLKFIADIEKHDIDVEWRYYNDGKAWLGKGLHKWTGVRGGQKEVTVFWLSIWDGFFRVGLFIPEKFRAEALALPLDDEMREKIEHSKQMGKLKFFPLTFDLFSDELFDTVYMLVDFRKTIK